MRATLQKGAPLSSFYVADAYRHEQKVRSEVILITSKQGKPATPPSLYANKSAFAHTSWGAQKTDSRKACADAQCRKQRYHEGVTSKESSLCITASFSDFICRPFGNGNYDIHAFAMQCIVMV